MVMPTAGNKPAHVEELDEHIRKALASAPPLSAVQCDRIARLLSETDQVVV